MRVPAVALVLLASLAACAMPPSPAYLSPGRYDTGPLRAQLLPMGLGGISFQVSRPAYVAVFEVNPGGGIAMLHPRFGGDALASHSGVHSVWRSWAHHSGSRARGATFSQVSSWGQRPWQTLQPRMYLLIASERPLEVTRYSNSPFTLQMALGSRIYTASPYSLADDIARLVVPNYHSDDWVTDVYFEWPEPAYQDAEPIPTHVLVCRDGSRLLAPVYIRICPQDAVIAPPLASDTAATPVEGRPQRPGMRRPERAGIRGDDATEARRPEVVRPERGVRPGGVREGEGEVSRPTREVERPQRAEPRGTRPAQTERTRPGRGAERTGQEAERPREPAARPQPRERPAPSERSEESNSPPRAEPTPRAQPSEPSRPAPAPPRAEPQAQPAPQPRSEPAPSRAEPPARSSEAQPPSFR